MGHGGAYVCQIQPLVGRDGIAASGRGSRLQHAARARQEVAVPSEGGERVPALERQRDVAGGEVQLQLVLQALVLQELGQVGDVEREELQGGSRAGEVRAWVAVKVQAVEVRAVEVRAVEVQAVEVQAVQVRAVACLCGTSCGQGLRSRAAVLPRPMDGQLQGHT